MSGLATLNDVAPDGIRKENPAREERQLLAYIRCLNCQEQCAIQTCGMDAEQRCHEFDDNKEIGPQNLHTHILCKCGERVFSGIVSFRTTRDTDAFNRKKKMTYEEKKKLFSTK